MACQRPEQLFSTSAPTKAVLKEEEVPLSYAGLSYAPTHEVQVLALRKIHHRHPAVLRLLRTALNHSRYGDHQAALHVLVRTNRIILDDHTEAARLETATRRVRAVVYLCAGRLIEAEQEIARALNAHLPDDMASSIRCRIVAAEIYLSMGQLDQARGQLIAVLDGLHHLDTREILHVGRLDARIMADARR